MNETTFVFRWRDVDDPRAAENFRELEDFLAKALDFITPIGGVIGWANPNRWPRGFLPCSGASHERSKYPELFDEIGTTFGSVDATHFNVPNIANLVTDVRYFIRAY